jgi:hypothetical protein
MTLTDNEYTELKTFNWFTKEALEQQYIHEFEAT